MCCKEFIDIRIHVRNTTDDATLSGLKRLAKTGVLRRHTVIRRGGLRFGIFGLMGKESIFYTSGTGAIALDAGTLAIRAAP